MAPKGAWTSSSCAPRRWRSAPRGGERLRKTKHRLLGRSHPVREEDAPAHGPPRPDAQSGHAEGRRSQFLARDDDRRLRLARQDRSEQHDDQRQREPQGDSHGSTLGATPRRW
jgi:hypothetical protein